jgi:hypothetical protein
VLSLVIPQTVLARADEAIELSFRSAVIDGAEATRWVNNCLDDSTAARQLCPQKQSRRRTIGVAEKGQFLPHAPAAKTARTAPKDVTDLPTGA